ncbi:dTDP-glucose 4,6-dehydratase [Streptomyces hydrogenans]|uniref:dTDP-glucose 4,6-dehydratase n=1 Tax=Streptomyces hydrogenans TaxID=1873719 RepID=UPI0033B01C58
MRILVTGGAGFIGSRYVRGVLGGEYPGAADAQVTVLDAFTYAGRPENLDPYRGDPRLRVIHGRIEDPEAVDRAMRGQDAVVHFAAESHVDRSIADGSAFVRTNVLGTQTLAEAAHRHGVGVFVHVSTDETYGSLATGSADEDHPLRPNSPYAASKAASDLVALAYHRTHGLDVRVTRCTNNYGPYQFPEKIVPLFVTRLLEGRSVPLYGDGLNIRDWLHVDDHCRGVQLVLENGRAGEVYNIGGGTGLTNLALTERLLGLFGAGPERIEYVEDRKGHDRRYALDWSKIRDELGYRPRWDLAEGLAATTRWYAENRSWWEPLRSAPADTVGAS